MPININGRSYDINYGVIPIESMGGNKLTYSMYGENIPIVLEAGEKIIKMKSGGDNNVLYLTDTGNLYGCGRNDYGQLGTGDTNDVTQFIKIAENVKDFYCNSIVTWYIDNNDDLYGCGNNSYGQQGSGDAKNVLTFTKRASNAKEVIFSTGGQSITFYVDKSGRLYGCGSNDNGRLGQRTTKYVYNFTHLCDGFQEVQSNSAATWIMFHNGWLEGAGTSANGIQGNGYDNGDSDYDVTRFDNATSDAVAFVSTTSNTWYLTDEGLLYGCGLNSSGELGTGSTKTMTGFAYRARNVKSFAVGAGTWYIDNDGAVWGTGNRYGTTAQVLSFTKRAEGAKEIKANYGTAFYITEAGELYGYGRNNYGQLGIGTAENVYEWTKVAENVKEFGIRNYVSWYKDNSNNLYMCGYNYYGQQGNGNTENVLTWTKIAENVKEITNIEEYTYSYLIGYVTNNGEAYLSGQNNYGQIGTGTTENVLSFTQVKNPKK